MKEVLGTLVEFPTVTADRDANNIALGYVSEYLLECGMYVQPYEFNGVRSMVATTRPGAKDSKVMLACHLDVVPANTDSDFTLCEEGDKLYGRGTLDMKFAAATNLSIVRDLADEGTLSKYDIALAFTTTEESGGYEDTERLLNDAGYRPQVCILPDGGDDWQMQISSKGYMHYKVIAAGKSAHSSKPWDGDNAIERLGKIIGAVRGLFPAEMGPDTNTNSINMIHGGQAANQVPDLAEFVSDARFVSPEEMARIRSAIGRICVENEAVIRTLTEGNPAIFDLNGPYLAPFARLIQEVTGIKVVGAKTLGSSDARFFAAKGIPVVSLYPTGEGHHSEHEWISKKALYQYKDVVRRYLDEIARTPAIVTS